jgi:hypothetical protein
MPVNALNEVIRDSVDLRALRMHLATLAKAFGVRRHKVSGMSA